MLTFDFLAFDLDRHLFHILEVYINLQFYVVVLILKIRSTDFRQYSSLQWHTSLDTFYKWPVSILFIKIDNRN